MALVASFLATEGMALAHEAHILFVDAVSERLFSAYALLEQRATGDFSRTATLTRFLRTSINGAERSPA